MAENSSIQWTDQTFNPWIGCTKISPACDNCYAELYDKSTMGQAYPQSMQNKQHPFLLQTMVRTQPTGLKRPWKRT